MTRRLLVALIALLTLTACASRTSSGEGGSTDSYTSLLTGEVLSAAPSNPVLVVKIDNTSNSAPQIGLDQADLVVEEEVEGGLTRLAAFYQSSTPNSVGHVRSLRATDQGIAAPVGGVLVASGGAQQTVDLLTSESIVLYTEDSGSPGFSSDPALSRPYNRLVDLGVVAEGMSVVDGVPYLTWAKPDAAPLTGTRTVTSAAVTFSGAQTTRWEYDNGSWTRTNGTASPEYTATNVLVLFAPQKDAGYLDPAGNPVPETEFVGSGRAVIFAGDQMIEGTWSKTEVNSTIKLFNESGKEIKLSPGRVWIELVPQGSGSIDAS